MSHHACMTLGCSYAAPFSLSCVPGRRQGLTEALHLASKDRIIITVLYWWEWEVNKLRNWEKSFREKNCECVCVCVIKLWMQLCVWYICVCLNMCSRVCAHACPRVHACWRVKDGSTWQHVKLWAWPALLFSPLYCDTSTTFPENCPGKAQTLSFVVVSSLFLNHIDNQQCMLII